MRKHKLDSGRALCLKSQLGMYKQKKRLPDELRKSKPRVYQRKACPVPGCHKVSLLMCIFLSPGRFILVTFTFTQKLHALNVGPIPSGFL